MAGRHVTVIGLSFLESSYSLGYKNTQFSIAKALIPICNTPKNGLQRKEMPLGCYSIDTVTQVQRTALSFNHLEQDGLTTVLNYIVKWCAELGP